MVSEAIAIERVGFAFDCSALSTFDIVLDFWGNQRQTITQTQTQTQTQSQSPTQEPQKLPYR